MKSFLKFVLGLILVLAILAIVGRIFVFEVAQTNSYSMVPSLVPGDYFLVNTVSLPGQGDIAVCENPEDPTSLVVLRIIGVPGNTVGLWKNHLRVDGVVVQHNIVDPISYEDTTSDETLTYDARVGLEKWGGHLYDVALMERGTAKKKMDDVTVPDDHFFLIGDNRNIARDSRNFGAVPIDSCIGIASFLVWPGEDTGTLLFKDRIFSWL